MDFVNALFEVGGMLFILPTIIKTYRNKGVQGVSFVMPVYFTIWGVWNLLYYPTLGQISSFFGATTTLTCNAIWCYQIWWYREKTNGN